MLQSTAYIAKTADEDGNVAYTAAEDAVWQTLITRQRDIIANRACAEFIAGLELLQLPTHRVPQCYEVSAVLRKTTGWALAPVPTLIPFEQFFTLLAQRRFPAATFIRRRDELDYLKEPDIFHEIFGHCPLLTNPAYAEFAERYGQLGLKATHAERVLLARVFWYTIEFGLLRTPQGLRAYGGGILSSINETVYCLASELPRYEPFDVLTMLKTPYRIDVIQPTYFILDSFAQLYELLELDLMALVRQVHALNAPTPLFPC